MAWYNKYRPQKFSDVIGQELVKSVLENSLAKNKIKHAYLFSGPKGVGKTTLARIFAYQLNDLENLPEAKIDIIELDAASNTSIDDVRQLIESAKTPPIQGKYKIFIIDEVHMLSKAAMNALLKILEEPPVYIVFLLATTNPEKLIPTVLSRLTKLNLSGHTEDGIIQSLKRILEQEKITFDDLSLKLIARRSGGSQRDAINLLETVASYELEINNEFNTAKLLGLLPQEILETFCKEIIANRTVSSQTIAQLEQTDLDGDTFLAQLLEMLLDRSLTGDQSFDELVLPVAEILDLRLPISSLVSSIALLQVKLREKSGTSFIPNSQPSSPTPPPKTPTNSNPTVTPSTETSEKKAAVPETTQNLTQATNNTENQVFSQNDSIIDDFFEFEDIPQQVNIEPAPAIENFSNESQQETDKVSKTTPDNRENTTNLSETAVDANSKTSLDSLPNEQALFSKLQSLSQVSTCPPILKMILQDISLEKMEGKKIYLNITSGIFLSQLKSPKLQTWILDQLKTQYGVDFEIVANQHKDNQKPKPTFTEPAKPQTIEKYLAPEPEAPATSTQEYASNKVISKNPKHDQEIFYSVYNQLPPNADSDKLNVISGPLTKPHKPTQAWDDHTHKLFDFE